MALQWSSTVSPLRYTQTRQGNNERGSPRHWRSQQEKGLGGAFAGIGARSLLEEFDSTIAASFVELVPNSYDFDLAQEYVAHFATQLRAPDALHLAVAHNNGVEFVATLDKGMLAAAKKLKIPARRVIR